MKNFLSINSTSASFAAFLFLLVLTFSCPAFCQEFQEKIAQWSIFKNERGDRIVCYVASAPINSDENNANRGEPFFLVTNLENDADEISVSSGFFYNKLSDVEIAIAAKKFYLFPHKTMAWANNKNDDIDIIKEMQKGGEMVITGVARDGKMAVDTYSLKDFSLAYEKLKSICRELR